MLQKIYIALLSFLLVACTGPIKRYDESGNEVVFITRIDESWLNSKTILADNDARGIAHYIAGVVIASKNRGKVWINYYDSDGSWETDGAKFKNTPRIFREPWPGYEKLSPLTWAFLRHDSSGEYLVACETPCFPVEDKTGKLKRHYSIELKREGMRKIAEMEAKLNQGADPTKQEGR